MFTGAGSWALHFFFLIWLGDSCHGTCHLGPVWFALASCEVWQDRPLTFPIVDHDFLVADFQVSC